jgi:hypothetical protein
MSDEHWTVDEMRNMAWQIEQLGKKMQVETPYGKGEPMIYGLCAEALYDAANQLEYGLEGQK